MGCGSLDTTANVVLRESAKGHKTEMKTPIVHLLYLGTLWAPTSEAEDEVAPLVASVKSPPQFVHSREERPATRDKLKAEPMTA